MARVEDYLDNLGIVTELLERFTRTDVHVHKVEGSKDAVLRAMDYAGIDYVAEISRHYFGIAYRGQDWAYRTYRTFTLRDPSLRSRPSEYEKATWCLDPALVPLLRPSLVIQAFTDGLNVHAAMCRADHLAWALRSSPHARFHDYSHTQFHSIPWSEVPDVQTIEYRRTAGAIA